MRLDAIPIGRLFDSTIAIVMLSMEVGHLLGHEMRRRSENEKESPTGAVAGGNLGPSAFTIETIASFAWPAMQHASHGDDGTSIRWPRGAWAEQR